MLLFKRIFDSVGQLCKGSSYTKGGDFCTVAIGDTNFNPTDVQHFTSENGNQSSLCIIQNSDLQLFPGSADFLPFSDLTTVKRSHLLITNNVRFHHDYFNLQKFAHIILQVKIADVSIDLCTLFNEIIKLTLGLMFEDLKTNPVNVYQKALDNVSFESCPSPSLEACLSQGVTLAMTNISRDTKMQAIRMASHT